MAAKLQKIPQPKAFARVADALFCGLENLSYLCNLIIIAI